ncbi:hypothetical protein [Amycolatopsis circi]|uniref:hypothetical protein n=1 Tax=Amycolatopsis circi TaxID=871959 RepID=UPI001FC9AAD7|nr:hypothetical protein [Amycolatopsis circi]
MGLLDAVRGIRVDEPGVAFVDGRGRRWGTVLANTSGKGQQTMTSEYEIMRGDLVRVLHEAVNDDARFVFGVGVESFGQDSDRVRAHFSDGSAEEFDLLIGADGQGSRIRRGILPAGPPPRTGRWASTWRTGSSRATRPTTASARATTRPAAA